MFLEHLQAAFTVVFTFDTLFALFAGVVIGTVIGAIPGMTVTMGVALTLPFTFSMHPAVGILLLLGVYKGGVYGGSITAILIKTPGTPAASCTVLDGYPMTQNGEARKALDIALYSSCFADFISNISLILFAGILASFALRFGPPEYFTLIVFSLTIIAGIAGDNMAKGMVAAGLGLLLATVGLDLVYGTNRLVFDEVELMAGLNFIPVLIGLFALPEIMNFYAKPLEDRGILQPLEGDGATFADFRRCFKSILRGSIIGVILGAIPGIGGGPAAFLSYSEARRTSKDPSRFGKGEMEGVAAAESGNNGTCGATMIPLLALGVPGDIVTAVILGAFMIHGLQPGPLLFQNNIELVYSLFIGIMVSSVFLFIVGKSAIRVFSHVVQLPNRLMFPIVLVLCIYGGYAVNNNMFDILVMMLVGLLGFAMLRSNIPSAPFLIAFVLGPLLEDNFRQSLLLSEGSLDIFVRNEICIIFWALTALVVFLLLRRQKVTAKLIVEPVVQP
ncbi:MAG: putative tricarboxylic transport membrane protein [Gammaproteobacteria bacterium]|jgi:putative tricarboxylic transport membrane protein